VKSKSRKAKVRYVARCKGKKVIATKIRKKRTPTISVQEKREWTFFRAEEDPLNKRAERERVARRLHKVVRNGKKRSLGSEEREKKSALPLTCIRAERNKNENE